MKDWKEKYISTNKKGNLRKETPKGMMYISTPEEIVNIIRTIPKGKAISSKELTHILSQQHNVDYTCGLTTGIFISIIANYVEQENIKNIPYWRITKEHGLLYDSYLREPSIQKEYLDKEGHKIIKKNNKYYINLNNN